MDIAEQPQHRDMSRKSAKHPAHELGFYQRSVFVTHLPYWMPWMMNVRDIDHMLLNRMRHIIACWAGTGNYNKSGSKMAFECSLGNRFRQYNCTVGTNEDGKEVKSWPRPPWRATTAEQKNVDNVLSNYVRLPNSFRNGKLSAYFSDTLTIEDAVIFFSGIGKVILGLLSSLAGPQREAFAELIDATANVLLLVIEKKDLPDFQKKMVTAQTKCCLALPLPFATMADHAFLEVFEPTRGRMVRYGTGVHLHMVVFERFNKLLRTLVTQLKSPSIHLMLSWMRMHMVEMQRASQPIGYFPTLPESSSILGAFRSGTSMEEDGPDYIRVDAIIRLVGRSKSQYLNSVQMESLHRFFLQDNKFYSMAHLKMLGRKNILQIDICMEIYINIHYIYIYIYIYIYVNICKYTSYTNLYIS